MIRPLLCLLFLAGEIGGTSALQAEWSEDNQPSDFIRRMETLERVVLEQDAKITRQENSLRHLSQDKFLCQQQHATLLHTERLLRAHAEETDKLKARLSSQERFMSTLQQQIQRLTRRERKRGSPTKTREKRPRIPDLLATEWIDTTSSQKSLRYVNPRSDDAQQVTEMGADIQKSKSQNEVSSAFHDVMPRSDDAGPLEAVVSHISQQVTEMGADLQAFKTQTSGDIQALKNSNRQQDLAIQDAQSSTFVHWGSATCSNASQLVYSGVVGGSDAEAHSGAASNFLCLTLSPVFATKPSPGPDKGYLYGSEYETYDPLSDDKDPVCAVCRSPYTTTVMVPGTNVCTAGWHLQYSGYLMTGAYRHPGGSEYICVDSGLGYRMGSDQGAIAAQLYFTVTVCGSLPCSPYASGKVVTCAVCSK